MTNREWLIKQMQNMSDEEFAELIHVPRKMDKEVCDTLGDCFPRECEDCKLDWLKAEHKEKIKLSDAERVILENVEIPDNRGELYIGRDLDGRLNIHYMEKPYKTEGLDYWRSQACMDFGMYNHLFQFIKWSDNEPYEIEELLRGE